MRQNSTFLSLLLAGLVGFFSFFMAPAALADTASDAEGGASEGEVYTIGTETTFAPFEFHDPPVTSS